MYILQVTHKFLPENIGGIAVYTLNLGSELAKNHQVHIFSGMHAASSENCGKDEEYQGLKVRKVSCDCQSIKPRSITVFKNKSFVESFETYISQRHPDIIHIQHSDELPFGLITTSKKHGIPVVVGLHDYTFLCPTEYLIDTKGNICNRESEMKCLGCVVQKPFSKISQLVPQNMLNSVAKLCYKFSSGNIEKNGGYTLREINALRYRINNLKSQLLNADMIIAPSESLRYKAIEWGIPKNQIVHILNGVKTNNLSKHRKKVTEKIIFGYIGRVVPIKGVHVLVKAFNRLNVSNSELRIHGNADTKYLNRLKEQSEGNENIIYFGRFEPNQLHNVLQDIDVLIVPSVCYENMPTVALEALSFGIPVIASNIGGLGEIIRDNENGFLFEISNDEELYEKMRLFTMDPYILDKLSKNIRNVKRIEDSAREIENVYMGLLN